MSDPYLTEAVQRIEKMVEEIKASQGMVRQGVQSVLARLGRDEFSVVGDDVEDKPEPTEEEMKQMLDEWRKKADEEIEKMMQERRSRLGLETGNEVTLDDEREYQEGWAR